MNRLEAIDSSAAEIQALRRDLHAHPELCFEEQRTSDRIANALQSWGVKVHRGLARTGVIGILQNGTSSRAMGLRADIDALPITEVRVAFEDRGVTRVIADCYESNAATIRVFEKLGMRPIFGLTLRRWLLSLEYFEARPIVRYAITRKVFRSHHPAA